MALNYTIDLNDTDGDSDYEEIEPNEYVKDGFIVSDGDGEDDADVKASRNDDVMTSESVMASIDARSDELWLALSKKQAAKWVVNGRKKREGEELLYKLSQFKTDKGKTEYVDMIRQEFNI